MLGGLKGGKGKRVLGVCEGKMRERKEEDEGECVLRKMEEKVKVEEC